MRTLILIIVYTFLNTYVHARQEVSEKNVTYLKAYATQSKFIKGKLSDLLDQSSLNDEVRNWAREVNSVTKKLDHFELDTEKVNTLVNLAQHGDLYGYSDMSDEVYDAVEDISYALSNIIEAYRELFPELLVDEGVFLKRYGHVSRLFYGASEYSQRDVSCFVSDKGFHCVCNDSRRNSGCEIEEHYPPQSVIGATSLAGIYNGYCAIKDGKVLCWQATSDSSKKEFLKIPQGITNPVQVEESSLKLFDICVLDAEGRKCFKFGAETYSYIKGHNIKKMVGDCHLDDKGIACLDYSYRELKAEYRASFDASDFYDLVFSYKNCAVSSDEIKCFHDKGSYDGWTEVPAPQTKSGVVKFTLHDLGVYNGQEYTNHRFACYNLTNGEFHCLGKVPSTLKTATSFLNNEVSDFIIKDEQNFCFVDSGELKCVGQNLFALSRRESAGHTFNNSSTLDSFKLNFPIDTLREISVGANRYFFKRLNVIPTNFNEKLLVFKYIDSILKSQDSLIYKRVIQDHMNYSIDELSALPFIGFENILSHKEVALKTLKAAIETLRQYMEKADSLIIESMVKDIDAALIDFQKIELIIVNYESKYKAVMSHYAAHEQNIAFVKAVNTIISDLTGVVSVQ